MLNVHFNRIDGKGWGERHAKEGTMSENVLLVVHKGVSDRQLPGRAVGWPCQSPGVEEMLDFPYAGVAVSLLTAPKEYTAPSQVIWWRQARPKPG